MPLKLTNNTGGGGGGDPVVQDSITVFHNAGAASGFRFTCLYNVDELATKSFVIKGDSNQPLFLTTGNGIFCPIPNIPIIASTMTVNYQAVLPGTAFPIYCEVTIQQSKAGGNPQIASIVWARNVDGTFVDDAGRNYYIAPRPSVTNLAYFSVKNDGSGFAAGFDQPVIMLSNFNTSFELDTTTTGVSQIYFDTSTSSLIHNNAIVGANITGAIPETETEQLYGTAQLLNIYLDDATGEFYHDFSFVPVDFFAILTTEVGYIKVKYNVNASSLYEDVYSNGSQLRFVSPTASNKTVFTTLERQPDYLG